MTVNKGQGVVTLTIAASDTTSGSHAPQRGQFPVALSFPSGTTSADFTIEYDVSDTSSTPDWRTLQWQDVDYAVSGAAGKHVALDQAATQALIYGYPFRLKSSATQTNSIDILVFLAEQTG